jgi:hypothetical protein
VGGRGAVSKDVENMYVSRYSGNEQKSIVHNAALFILQSFRIS